MIAARPVTLSLKDRTSVVDRPNLFGPSVHKVSADRATFQTLANQIRCNFPAINVGVVTQGLCAVRTCWRIQTKVAKRLLVLGIAGIDDLTASP